MRNTAVGYVVRKLADAPRVPVRGQHAAPHGHQRRAVFASRHRDHRFRPALPPGNIAR